MNIIQFTKEFPDDIACRSHFRASREREGVVCKKCSCTKQWWLKNKSQWKCSQCGFRTTLRSGTFMQDSNLSIYQWYLAMVFMSFSKKGISASELQRQMSIKNYDTVWSLMHRIRKAMGNRDSLYGLNDMQEVDEGFIVTATPSLVKENLKRGRGSKRVSPVAVAVESIPLEDIETGQISRQCRYFKMKQLSGLGSQEVEDFVQENLHKESVVFSDMSTSYTKFINYIDTHITVKSSNVSTRKTLQWVHIAIANLKRTLLGIYHRINEEYLQLYLDEFCYKLNRRYFKDKLFDRLVVAVIGN